MKNYLLLPLLFIGLHSCDKESENAVSNIPKQEKNNLLIKHEGTLISSTEASNVATLFFENNSDSETKNTNSTKQVKSITTITDENSNPLMYVINFDPTGFTIISATKNYTPVLAYSDKYQFSLNTNTGIEDWITETKDAIKLCDDLPTEEIFKNRIMWVKYEQSAILPETITRAGSASQAFHERVTQLRNSNPGYNFYPLSNVGASMFPLSNTYDDLCNLADGYNSPREYTIIGIKTADTFTQMGPLLTTAWHQGYPFNGLIPDTNCPAGCVAIAMAQIMNFHKYPTGYNWDEMTSEGATYDTKRLIRDIGRDVGMKYGISSSSSNIDKAASAFINNYGYSAIKRGHNANIVKDEITTKRNPIYMRGQERQDPDSGHAWVCDGITTGDISTIHIVEFIYGGPGYYNFSDYGHYSQQTSYSYYHLHMNWGWYKGESNGWYKADDANPYQYNFTNKREELYLHPNR